MPTKVLILGSTGMIGGGTLREALENPEIESIILLNRKPGTVKHPKVKEVIHGDFYAMQPVMEQFREVDAVLFCLGQSAVGMTEPEYHRVTYELTVKFAEELLKVNPHARFIYISGAGTDSSESGSQMWARVKGKTENALLKMPFRSVHMVRPGYIQPRKGIRSRTGWYNLVYTVFYPLYILFYPFKGVVTDTTRLGRAMIRIAINGADLKIIEQRDINRIAEA